ncbi:MAG: hypothetical protein MZU97_03205 [Bacillus subtilis]|nr:hypothetical protein [Bacillus subtilis]
MDGTTAVRSFMTMSSLPESIPCVNRHFGRGSHLHDSGCQPGDSGDPVLGLEKAPQHPSDEQLYRLSIPHGFPKRSGRPNPCP